MTRRTRPWPPGVPCWAEVAVPDLGTARAFYAAVLGWEVGDGDPAMAGYAFARRGGAVVAGVGPLLGADERPSWTVHLATDDVDATARAAQGAGGRVLAGPHDVPGTGRFVVLADPSGAVTGAWQAVPAVGCELVNEAGGLLWEDLRSDDPDASRAFLAAVFGVVSSTFDGGPDGYQVFSAPGEQAPAGATGPLFGAPAAHWQPYFQVEDVEAAVAAAAASGGTVVTGPSDSPFGRSAVLADPGGALFAVITPPAGAPRPDRS